MGLLAWAVAVTGPAASAADWTASASTFTHDPTTGHRVQQYAPVGPVYHYPTASAGRSSYRHMRSTIQVGNSADNMHFVEQSGQPVRPYGEWRFPFRPHSVPSQLWAPPFPGLYGGFPPFGWGVPGGAYGDPWTAGPGLGTPGYGSPGYGNPGYGNPGYGNPGYGNPGYGHPGYRNRRDALEDGRYRSFDNRRMPDSLFFDRPPFDASRPQPLPGAGPDHPHHHHPHGHDGPRDRGQGPPVRGTRSADRF